MQLEFLSFESARSVKFSQIAFKALSNN